MMSRATAPLRRPPSRSRLGASTRSLRTYPIRVRASFAGQTGRRASAPSATRRSRSRWRCQPRRRRSGRPAPIGYAVQSPFGVELSAAEKELVPGAPPIDDVVKGTPYAKVLELTRRLVAAPVPTTPRCLGLHRFLNANYTYDQDVEPRRDPLPAFLLRDRRGYCQQFAGAMSLMLRMAGIPSRVVSGFAPGVREDDRTFSVADTDAHSWVEVLYPGVGWVTVDPTPAQTPAHTDVTLPNAGLNGGITERGLGRAFTEREGERDRPSDVKDQAGRSEDEASRSTARRTRPPRSVRWGDRRHPSPPAPPQLTRWRGPPAPRASGGDAGDWSQRGPRHDPGRDSIPARARTRGPRPRATRAHCSKAATDAVHAAARGRLRGERSAGRLPAGAVRSAGGERCAPSRLGARAPESARKWSRRLTRSRCKRAHTHDAAALSVATCSNGRARGARPHPNTWASSSSLGSSSRRSPRSTLGPDSPASSATPSAGPSARSARPPRSPSPTAPLSRWSILS